MTTCSVCNKDLGIIEYTLCDDCDDAKWAGLEEELARRSARIAELEAERRWVPVGERLPSERANRVLALTVPGCRIVAHYGSLGDWVDMSGAIRDVTQWMPLPPLPAPPKKEEK